MTDEKKRNSVKGPIHGDASKKTAGIGEDGLLLTLHNLFSKQTPGTDKKKFADECPEGKRKLLA